MKLRLLLVEDDPDYARLVLDGFEILRSSEVEAEHANSLGEAVAKLSRGKFDAVLLDLRLGDAKGFDAMLQIRASAPQLPIVVVTSLDDARAEARALRFGAQDFVLKSRATPEGLARSARHAVLRQRFAEEREAERDREQARSFRIEVDAIEHSVVAPLEALLRSVANDVGLALRDSSEADPARRALTRVATTVEQARQYCHGVRAQAASHRVAKVRVELNQLVRDALPLLSAEIETALELRLDPAALDLEGDGPAIESLLLDLMREVSRCGPRSAVEVGTFSIDDGAGPQLVVEFRFAAAHHPALDASDLLGARENAAAHSGALECVAAAQDEFALRLRLPRLA